MLCASNSVQKGRSWMFSDHNGTEIWNDHLLWYFTFWKQKLPFTAAITGFLVSATFDQTSALLITGRTEEIRRKSQVRENQIKRYQESNTKKIKYQECKQHTPVHVKEGKVLILHLFDIRTSCKSLLVSRHHYCSNAWVLQSESSSWEPQSSPTPPCPILPELGSAPPWEGRTMHSAPLACSAQLDLPCKMSFGFWTQTFSQRAFNVIMLAVMIVTVTMSACHLCHAALSWCAARCWWRESGRSWPIW